MRVSNGENGFDSDGNTNGFDASIAAVGINPDDDADQALELILRSVSDDGSRIVFSTARPLSERAVNGVSDVYEWYAGEGGEGAVSLISGGTSPGPDENQTISPSGRDLFFETAEGLVPSDTDGLLDVYDARIGGGFPSVAATLQACSGDACQGPLTNPAPLLVPGSASQAAGGNFPEPVVKSVKKKVKLKAKLKKKRKKSKKKGKVGKGVSSGKRGLVEGLGGVR